MEEKKTTTAKEKRGLQDRLRAVQVKLKAPKNQYNSFGKYKYRSFENILEALKPLLAEQELTLTFSDRLEHTGDRYYFVTTATLKHRNEVLECSSLAREDESRAGMSESQVSGATLSYVHKYCISNLFLLDDQKDSDSEEFQNHKAKKAEPEKTAALDLDAYLREVSELKTKAQVNAWWGKNHIDIPEDIAQAVYDACVKRGRELNQ